MFHKLTQSQRRCYLQVSRMDSDSKKKKKMPPEKTKVTLLHIRCKILVILNQVPT